MSQRLVIIQRALVQTGNNPPQAENDGSAEWLAGSMSYEAQFEYVAARASWPFIKLNAELDQLADNVSARFQYSYARKPDDIHLRSLFWRRTTSGANQFVPITYEIVRGNVACDYDDDVWAEYYSLPANEETWSPLFKMALQRAIEADLYQSLNEDGSSAARAREAAEMVLAEAKTLLSAQAPGRLAVQSRILARRRYGVSI